MIFLLFGGVLLGWSLGSNDAANVFGTAVASRIVRYSTAIILASVFVILGALVQGASGMHTIGSLTSQSLFSACIVSVTAALTVLLMTLAGLPVSTSQAVIGAIAGFSLGSGQGLEAGPLSKVVLCWIGTPLGAAAASIALYPLLSRLLDALKLNLVGRSNFIRISLTAAGCYGAYALGANNVANVTGVYYASGLFADTGFLRPETAAVLVGGCSIALGIMTFSRRVMTTVGSRLIHLDGFSSLVATTAAAAAVHAYAFAGVPVSTSQAVVGAVLGIGLHKGMRTINRKTVYRVFFGWVCTPLLPGAACFVIATVLRRS